MHLLLCAATEFEIAPTIQFLRSGHYPHVDVLITGIGMMSATYRLTRSIAEKRPDFVLQAGVAGCIDMNFPLTKVVIVQNEHIGDLGVHEKGHFNSLFRTGLANENDFPFQDGKLKNDLSFLKDSGLTIVDGVTVNEISTSQERIAYYREQLHVAIETMEGAALHYVCLQEKVRFLQIRSLSNFIGVRDKSQWVLDIAVAQLNTELQRILTKSAGQ